MYYIVQKDVNSIISGSVDFKLLKEWDLVTGCVVKSCKLPSSTFWMTRTNDNSSFICGLDRIVEKRRMSDLGLIRKVNLAFQSYCSCILEDGTVVMGGSGGKIERWDENLEQLLTTFSDHSEWIHNVIALNNNEGTILIAIAYGGLRMWRASGECFRTISLPQIDYFDLVKLSPDKFATASGKQIQVHNDNGDCIETINHPEKISIMIRVGHSLVTFSSSRISVWQLK